MPNKKISQLNVNTNPTFTDALPIVNGGETKQISLSGLTNYVNSYSLSNLGFVIRPRPIQQNVLLPDNSDILYFGPLQIGIGYTITVPITTTLTIQ
jgi:hypothetical protein